MSLSVTPNPFNASTRLPFDPPLAELVKVEVFDLAGRNVGNVGFATNSGPFGGESDLQWMQAGYHEVRFDGSDLPSGVYLVRVEASGLRQPRLPHLSEGRAPSRPQAGGIPPPCGFLPIPSIR
jgi:hypothetical protein